jgi:hypothetical protein
MQCGFWPPGSLRRPQRPSAQPAKAVRWPLLCEHFPLQCAPVAGRERATCRQHLPAAQLLCLVPGLVCQSRLRNLGATNSCAPTHAPSRSPLASGLCIHRPRPRSAAQSLWRAMAANCAWHNVLTAGFCLCVRRRRPRCARSLAQSACPRSLVAMWTLTRCARRAARGRMCCALFLLIAM